MKGLQLFRRGIGRETEIPHPSDNMWDQNPFNIEPRLKNSSSLPQTKIHSLVFCCKPIRYS